MQYRATGYRGRNKRNLLPQSYFTYETADTPVPEGCEINLANILELRRVTIFGIDNLQITLSDVQSPKYGRYESRVRLTADPECFGGAVARVLGANRANFISVERVGAGLPFTCILLEDEQTLAEIYIPSVGAVVVSVPDAEIQPPQLI